MGHVPTAITSGLTFEQFSQQWLTASRNANPSTVELDHQFARKLSVQWLDRDESTGELVYCDGSGDGGIDAAYLDCGRKETTEEGTQGDTWLLIQSKYGKAFQGGTATL